MLIKIQVHDSKLEQEVELLKLRYRKGAASKAVLEAIQEHNKISMENEILRHQNLSMTAEIERLRELLSLHSNDLYRY